MKNLKNYFISGMIGAGSLIGFNGYGQDVKKDTINNHQHNEINALENSLKRGEIVDTLIEIYNSMIPTYNQCIRNGTKSSKDNCERIFLVKLTSCNSLLKKFKSLPFQNDYYSAEVVSVFDNDLVPFTNENADQLLNTNEKIYKITQFLLDNPSQKNYDVWWKELETYKKDCKAVFKQ